MMPAEKKTRHRKERIDGVTSRTMCNDKSEIRKKLTHFEANIS